LPTANANGTPDDRTADLQPNLDGLIDAILFGNPPEPSVFERSLADLGLNQRQFNRAFRTTAAERLRSKVADAADAGQLRPGAGIPPAVFRVDLYTVFDRIVVISLRRRPDRLRAFQAQLEQMRGSWPHRPVEVLRAVDGASGAVPTPGWFRQGGGAYGCWRSHLNALEGALMDGLNSLYILEDDALFDYNYPELMQRFMDALPADWEVAFPGGQHHGAYEKVSDGVVRGQNIQRTHCYALRGRDVIAHLYQMWTEWPVQNPYQDFHCDWLLGPWTGLRKSYAPERFFVGQARTRSDINGRLNASRLWNPPDPTAPVLWLRSCSRPTLESLVSYGIHPGYDRDDHGQDRGLNEAFRDGATADDVRNRLTRWDNDLQWEVASMLQPGIVCLWHPKSTAFQAIIEELFGRRLMIVDEDDIRAALRAWAEYRLSRLASKRIPTPL
jgi:hypothetical protein